MKQGNGRLRLARVLGSVADLAFGTGGARVVGAADRQDAGLDGQLGELHGGVLAAGLEAQQGDGVALVTIPCHFDIPAAGGLGDAAPGGAGC